MIKATIQNSLYCTEIRFPCSETELSKKLAEIGMNSEHLAPMVTVIEIEPAELSMLTDCDVSLDALNFLGKRMDGMCKTELRQFLAVLSCDEADIGCSLKNVINLTYNLERFTLIEDTDDLESVGRTHILNVRGYISESESNNHEWLSEHGVKLLESGSGIETDYGKIYINKDVPFKEVFNGTTFPAYYCEMNSVAEIVIEYDNLTEFVELPCEDITIKKALCRLGADGIKDCKIIVDSTRDITDEWSERISDVEKTKDLFGLNNLLKTKDILLKQEQPVSIFKQELSRRLSGEGYNFSFENGEFAITLSGGDVIKIRENDVLYSNGDFSEVGKDTFYALYRLNREVLDYCTAYEKAEPLIADGLSEKYRCLAEFGGTVLAAMHTEYGFEFATWDRTYDGKSVCQCYKMIQQQNLHFVVDVDIKGFFDNVNHSKLMRQMWTLGIRDKQLICIIKEMLKAPIIMPDGSMQNPTKGTPQGGILSPLLANIVLNELDWWISSQWEKMPTHNEYKIYYAPNGTANKQKIYNALRTSTLKEIYIVRYADDFKIFCRKRSDANKIFIAVKQWLKDRLSLEISEEKSKVVNLKKDYSEFLGFKIKAIRKGGKFLVRSHMSDKAVKRVTNKLKEQVVKIEHSRNRKAIGANVNQYNLMVLGIHNYYRYATEVNKDCNRIQFIINLGIYHRLRELMTNYGQSGYSFISKRYNGSKMLLYICQTPMCPIGYVQTKNPMYKKKKICKYTAEGREEIHRNLKFDETVMTRQQVYGLVQDRGQVGIQGKIRKVCKNNRQDHNLGGR